MSDVIDGRCHPTIEPLEARSLLSACPAGMGAKAMERMDSSHRSDQMSSLQMPMRQMNQAGHRALPKAVRKLPAAQKAEVHFLTQMIDHHQMAIAMGELAVEKAVHPELRQLGQEIIETQTREIAQMQAWLVSWYGIEHEPQMTRRDQRQMDKLEAKTGEAFEISFLRQMIPHHRMAVMMSQHIALRAVHPELKALANDMIETQSEEIEQMQHWLSDWYGIETGARGHMGGGMGGGMSGGMNGR